MIALLNLSVLGFSFVFHDKAKRTQKGDLLALCRTVSHIKHSHQRLRRQNENFVRSGNTKIANHSNKNESHATSLVSSGDSQLNVELEHSKNERIWQIP